MFAFHGWAVIRYHAHDTDRTKQDACWRVVEHYVSKNAVPECVWLSRYNGQDSLSVTGMHNHRQEYVVDLFRWLGAHAPGSYGLLHVHDDEDLTQGACFRVWCLKRGRVTEHEDRFLSPLIPTVEDPSNPERDD